MARVDIIMPQMGESIAEGTLSKWLKKVGDTVKRDEPIFEISTDKVDAEIPSPVAGVLAEILVPEGETVAVQTVVARIETEKGAAIAAAPVAAAPAVSAPERGAPPAKNLRHNPPLPRTQSPPPHPFPRTPTAIPSKSAFAPNRRPSSAAWPPSMALS